MVEQSPINYNFSTLVKKGLQFYVPTVMGSIILLKEDLCGGHPLYEIVAYNRDHREEGEDLIKEPTQVVINVWVNFQDTRGFEVNSEEDIVPVKKAVLDLIRERIISFSASLLTSTTGAESFFV